MQEKGAFICPVCASTEWRSVYRIQQWGIEECLVCALARIDPLPARDSRPALYSQEKVVERNAKEKTRAQKFSRAMKRFFNKIAKRNKNKIFHDKLSRYLPAGSKILDVGCGDGSFLSAAKDKFACTGVEISEYLADLARRQAGIKVISGDFLSLNLLNEKFDGVTLISLLEHLNDPQGSVKRCFELLKQGGVLLIKTVNYGCLNRVFKKKEWTGFRPPDHLFYFNPANLKALLKKAGFSKIRISAWPFSDNMYCDARK